jgi:hypothetical protein
MCTENLILIDYVTESPNVGGDDVQQIPKRFPGVSPDAT